MLANINLWQIFEVLIISFIVILPCSKAEKTIATYAGTIGPGNYTYFSLHEKGTITIIVESKVGDADLYVSQHVPKPSYSEYDLQSSTCGVDMVTVPSAFKRPVYISIYGHIHSLETKYTLTAILNYTGSYEWGSSHFFANIHPTDYSNPEDDGSPSFQSILWSIIVGVLKIILEVMF
eukprot:gene19873-21815_t